MRGCLDRFMLFGLDTDIKISISGSRKRICRTMDRRLMNLVPLNDDFPLVLICSCVGDLCNDDEVESSSTIRCSIADPFFLFIPLPIIFLNKHFM